MKPQAFTAKETGDAYLCMCRRSKNQPFCDGAHAKLSPADTMAMHQGLGSGSNALPRVADNKPMKVAVEAGKEYYYCTCGLSKNQPW